MACLAEGRVEESLRLIRRHAVEFPVDGRAWTTLAASYLAAGGDEEALAAYRRAWLIEPEDTELPEAIAEIALSKPVTDLDVAIRASRTVEPPNSRLADLWAKAALRFAESRQPIVATAAAWEAQRLAERGSHSPSIRACRQLADVDLAPFTSEPAADVLAERGYAVLPGADAEQVDALRHGLLSFPLKSAIPNVLSQFPALVDVILQPRVVDWLRRAMGTPHLIVPFVNVASQFYTTWHTDSADMPNRGRDFEQGPSTLVLTMLIYLQDNRPFSAGGLNVFPGSHRSPEEIVTGTERMVATRAGDLLIIDTRLLHRASRRLLTTLDPQPKALFQLNWAADARHARRYMETYARTRAQGQAPEPAFLRELEKRCTPAGIGLIY